MSSKTCRATRAGLEVRLIPRLWCGFFTGSEFNYILNISTIAVSSFRYGRDLFHGAAQV